MDKRKLTIALVLLFALNITIICITRADAAVYKQGSTGSVVSQIQRRLNQWGYYNYDIDGIYGSRTTAAVKSFQSNNGLKADGISGVQTLTAMGVSGGASTEENNVNLLARLISAEARGEPYSGQVAVGAVVLNRVEHPSFPNSVSGVIYQSGAFSCVTDGQFNEPIASSAYQAARDAINGWDPSGGAIYYFNPAKATSKWIWSRPVILQIGKHLFCE